ncbi:HAMP domain-containing sensor histidine kinase [Janthinobacterium sp.]|uniref:sensor histidine kinase n=1 Tax=Janthinobacterium sp. TaxID=1871054 RepID=UPI00293D8469|nr:HAMP domain-containing sensor histidine kinase [Janthinobacterium sp.]
MRKLRGSIAARLALGYGLLVALSIVLVAGVFYFGTIGVLDSSIDRKIVAISAHLIEAYEPGGMTGLARNIERQLSDRIDSDTEIFLLVAADGSHVAGNLPGWSEAVPLDMLLHRDVLRDGQLVPVRLIVRALPNGARLFVGRDLHEWQSIRALVWRALASGAGAALLLVVGGALVFRRQLEGRLGTIRRTAREIEAGDLTRRIPVQSHDEFGLLSRDINRMLDRIEHLMEGVRHVSNAIAHDLRTPLGRIRGKLEETLRRPMTLASYAEAAQDAIEDIDELTLVFEKLLQIAAAESGMRPESFDTLDLSAIVADIVDLYDATAEEKGVRLVALPGRPVPAAGDRNLLGSALASLIDNAIKYAGQGGLIEVSAYADAQCRAIVVRDYGPGVPEGELPKVTQRFYRLDKSRHLPGNGLGLSIVAAIAALHGGSLRLENAGPGLEARLLLPPQAPDAGAEKAHAWQGKR